MKESASVPLAALTVWQMLVEHAQFEAAAEDSHSGWSRRCWDIRHTARKASWRGGRDRDKAPQTSKLVKSLGADVVVDYKKQDFETVLSGCDVVLHSLDSETPQKSLNVLKPGGKVISISGPPDVKFAEAHGLNWVVQQIVHLLSSASGKRRRRGALIIRSYTCVLTANS